jgi:hypothetical protein
MSATVPLSSRGQAWFHALSVGPQGGEIGRACVRRRGEAAVNTTLAV